MSDRIFLDSNIVIYSYSDTELDKQAIARMLMSENNSFVSTQVLQELCNTLTKKYKFTFEEAIDAVKETCQNNNLYINDNETVVHACNIAIKYRYAFYECLIIAAAIKSRCKVLYSEDLQDGQIIDNILSIRNPFK